MLLANIASVISENPAYQEQGQQHAQQTRAEALKIRADNLEALKDIWGKKAEAAQRAGDLEAELAARSKHEQIGRVWETVKQNAEHVLKLDEQKQQQAAAIGLEQERQRGDIETLREMKRLGLNKSGGVAGVYGQFDPAGVAAGILDGTVPPSSTGFSRGQWGLIVGEIRKIDPKFSVTKAGLDYSGVLQHVKTLNQSQQVVLRQRAQNAGTTAAYIEELIQEIEAKAPPRTPVSVINSIQLSAIKNGAWGSEAADAATRLGAQIAAWRLEMGSVYAGGYAPQEQHLKQGAHLIEDNWSLNRMRAGLQVGARDTNIRLQAVNEAGAVTPSNPLLPGGSSTGGIHIGPNVIPGSGESSGGGLISVTAPNGKTYYFASQQQADLFKKRAGIP